MVCFNKGIYLVMYQIYMFNGRSLGEAHINICVQQVFERLREVVFLVHDGWAEVFVGFDNKDGVGLLKPILSPSSGKICIMPTKK
jgi:hypothetical protein